MSSLGYVARNFNNNNKMNNECPNFHIVEFEILTIEVVWIAESLDELALDFETPLRFLGRIEVQS